MRYEEPKMDGVWLYGEDVIITSPLTDGGEVTNPDEPGLPLPGDWD